MRCKPGQDFLPYDRPIAVSKIGSTSRVREREGGKLNRPTATA